MMISTSSNCVVVESSGRGMQSEAFKNRLDAVLKMINNGAIGGGIGGYGGAEHSAALDAIEKQLAETRKSIAEDNAANPYKPRLTSWDTQ